MTHQHRSARACWRCKGLRRGELVGDDDCRYYKFECATCGTKWTENLYKLEVKSEKKEPPDQGSNT